MDTDVEVLKPLDPFLRHVAFSGFEDEENVPTGIMASEKGSLWAKENLDYYNGRHFLKDDGSFDNTTNVFTITNYMLKHGLVQNNTLQDFPNLITMYPKEYFCPLSWNGRIMHLTENTVTIHHFAGSWLPLRTQLEQHHPKIFKKHPILFKYFIYAPVYIYRKWRE